MRSLLAVLLAAIVITSPCFGWGADGHKIIGSIASASLTESAAKEVRELLGEQSIADACCWADEIRSESRYDWVKPLHYINVPRDAKTIDMARDGADGQQVVSAIGKYRDILKDANRPKEERAEALRLLLHFVGDIHQPFHVSYKEDKGGNMLSVQAFGTKSNMHRVWDSDLISRRLRDTKGGWAVMSADLRQAITDEQRKKWTVSLDPATWANESLTLTRELYANLPTNPDDVGESYYQRWMPTAEKQLQAAGVRLAALLNAALDKPAAATK
ncbi:MAG: S1/P1 nuclease [Phycisphaerales bacterium]